MKHDKDFFLDWEWNNRDIEDLNILEGRRRNIIPRKRRIINKNSRRKRK